MKLLVTALLSDYKLRTKLIGLIQNHAVDEVILVRRKTLPGLPKIRNVTPSGPCRDCRWLYEIWRFKSILHLIWTEKIDVLIGIQMVLHGLQIALIGRLSGLPYVLSVIGKDVHRDLFSPVKGPFLAWALRGAQGITVMGPRSRQILMALPVPEKRLFEIQNHQDPKRFAPDTKAPKPWDLLFVGALVRRKRLDRLLHAVADVSKTLPAVRLGLLGRGPEETALKELTHRLSIEENVTFLGHDPQVESHLQAAQVFVMTSSFEGVPAAAIEAMLCGLPVILTDVGDIPGVFVNDRNALLVPPGDHVALVSAITALLTDTRTYTRLQQGALYTRKAHLKRWDLTGQTKAWEVVFDHVRPPLKK